MMDDKALGLLGIARRAGRLSLGHDAAKGAVLAGRARLCLISADASDRLEREFFRMTQVKRASRSGVSGIRWNNSTAQSAQKRACLRWMTTALQKSC